MPFTQEIQQKRTPVNLLYRLRDRQVSVAPPSAQINQVRSLYESLPPTSLVCKVECPDSHICRFTPSGELLVAFGPVARELVVYRHRPMTCTTQGELPSGWLPPNAQSFNSHFCQVFRVTLAHGTETLVKDFVLTLHEERFLLIVKVTPSQHGETGTAGNPLVPVIESTTLVLVNARDGSVADSYLLQDDFVHASHNFGIHLWDDLLLVTGVRQQTLYVLQVLPSGRFVKVQSLGAQCNDDDQLFLELYEERERRWQQQHTHAQAERPASHLSAGASHSASSSAASISRASSSPLSRAASTAAGTDALPTATADPRNPTGVPQQGDGGQARTPFPPPLPALHSIPSQASTRSVGDKNVLIEGLKHKILVFLLKMKQQEAAEGNHEAMKQFHYVFETYVNLLMWKAQFLDRQHLLIAMGNPETVMARSMDIAPVMVFFVVYDLATNTVRKLTLNNNDNLVGTYLRHAPMLHAADVDNDCARFVTPTPIGLQPLEQQERALQRQWGAAGHRRILANLPVSSQMLCASPYLDGKLFHYDDKLVSAVVRPRVYSDSIVRFVSKRHPETCKFRLAGDCFDLPPTHGRAIKQVIHHHFHPVLPFIMSYLQTFVAGPQICIHTRY